ncbi:MAG: polymer-forming cytoskeletal protein [Planctomycetota bacterium]
MARPTGPRRVQCYHCGHRLEVSARAQSTSCPGCNKAIYVADLVLSKYDAVKSKQTCGKIIVKKKGRLIADLVEANEGIEVEGVLEAKQVISGQPVVIKKKAVFQGHLQAPSCIMEEGATIKPSLFDVPSDPKNLADLHDPPEPPEEKPSE